jgi:hypothetical protein
MEVMETADTTDSDAQAEECLARRGRGRPRGSGRKTPKGATAIAKKLKTIGIAGSSLNTNGMVAALGFDADHRPPSTELLEALKTLQPEAYEGTRLNVLARLGRQAPPVVQPSLLPPPWTDASEPRDWQAIATHTAQCLLRASKSH